MVPLQHYLIFLRQTSTVVVLRSASVMIQPSPRQIQRVMRRGSVVFALGAKRKNGRPAFVITRQRVEVPGVRMSFPAPGICLRSTCAVRPELRRLAMCRPVTRPSPAGRCRLPEIPVFDLPARCR
jgi:hypothetical protein